MNNSNFQNKVQRLIINFQDNFQLKIPYHIITSLFALLVKFFVVFSLLSHAVTLLVCVKSNVRLSRLISLGLNTFELKSGCCFSLH